MKKHLAIMMMCIVVILSFTCVSASYLGIQASDGFVIEFNGEATDDTSVIFNHTHYVPMRIVFEKMGASVFYRSRDCQILALSRDGDMIRHIV